jgi:hypothetical protein
MKGRIALLLVLLAACDDGVTDVRLGPGEGGALGEFIAAPTWVDEGWNGVSEPVGHAAVQLSWALPAEFRDEVFRVYGRPAGGGRYSLVATVTSCTGGYCYYTDDNVAEGESYDYYVASVDQDRGRELDTTDELRVDVPDYSLPSTPTIERAVGLDGAVFLRWGSTGAARYRVFLERQDEDSVFFEIGSTDGDGYVDLRAENGTTYGYRIAAVSENGVTGARSALLTAVPRPDFHADLLYPLDENADSSGFHFVSSDAESPTLAGDDADAQWRIETVDGVLSIVPLGQTQVTEGRFTTALTCGPASEANCVSVDEATADLGFDTDPVPVYAGYTYVFRLGSGSDAHYGKVRVDGVLPDGLDRSAVIFDWAYQLVAGETRLDLGRR